MLRPTVLFAAAYTIIGILHELAHALTAYALNVPSIVILDLWCGWRIDQSKTACEKQSKSRLGLGGSRNALSSGSRRKSDGPRICFCAIKGRSVLADLVGPERIRDSVLLN
jgi:hypothetical protein